MPPQYLLKKSGMQESLVVHWCFCIIQSENDNKLIMLKLIEMQLKLNEMRKSKLNNCIFYSSTPINHLPQGNEYW